MTRYQRNDNWVGSHVDDSFVMLHIDAGDYVVLNETALAIWTSLETPRTAAEVVDALLSEYAVERSACEASVSRTLEEMAQKRLVDPA